MHITSIVHQTARERSCPMLVVAVALRYVRFRGTTPRRPAIGQTPPRPFFMPPWAPAMPFLAYPAVFIWLLAPAICSQLCTRLTTVMCRSYSSNTVRLWESAR